MLKATPLAFGHRTPTEPPNNMNPVASNLVAPTGHSPTEGIRESPLRSNGRARATDAAAHYLLRLPAHMVGYIGKAFIPLRVVKQIAV